MMKIPIYMWMFLLFYDRINKLEMGPAHFKTGNMIVSVCLVPSTKIGFSRHPMTCLCFTLIFPGVSMSLNMMVKSIGPGKIAFLRYARPHPPFYRLYLVIVQIPIYEWMYLLFYDSRNRLEMTPEHFKTVGT
jgi:hypothetical protein